MDVLLFSGLSCSGYICVLQVYTGDMEHPPSPCLLVWEGGRGVGCLSVRSGGWDGVIFLWQKRRGGVG